MFFQTQQLSSVLPDSLPGHGSDNAILAQSLALQALHTDTRVVLVSKDINLRIKAAVVGVHAEDYFSDRTIEDVDVLYSGQTALTGDFWDRHGKDMRSWREGTLATWTWSVIGKRCRSAMVTSPCRIWRW